MFAKLPQLRQNRVRATLFYMAVYLARNCPHVSQLLRGGNRQVQWQRLPADPWALRHVRVRNRLGALNLVTRASKMSKAQLAKSATEELYLAQA
jgi:hypothetical protein